MAAQGMGQCPIDLLGPELMSGPARPTLALERKLMRAGAPSVAGIDEVGRGSLAGPVTVGVVVVLPGTPSAPTGVRDSKELTAAHREARGPNRSV